MKKEQNEGMAKHWKKRHRLPLQQRRCAQIVSTRWYRTLGPSFRKYFSEFYNNYDLAQAKNRKRSKIIK